MGKGGTEEGGDAMPLFQIPEYATGTKVIL